MEPAVGVGSGRIDSGWVVMLAVGTLRERSDSKGEGGGVGREVAVPTLGDDKGVAEDGAPSDFAGAAVVVVLGRFRGELLRGVVGRFVAG